MQAIHTKYLPATNTRGSRIKATCDAGALTIGFPHGEDDAHAYTANLLFVKLGWNDGAKLASGTLPNGDGCHVMVGV